MFYISRYKQRISKQKLSLPVLDKIDEEFLSAFIKESTRVSVSNVKEIVDFIKISWQENLLPRENKFFGYTVFLKPVESGFASVEITR